MYMSSLNDMMTVTGGDDEDDEEEDGENGENGEEDPPSE